ncbi:unnamed protein product, partial [Prunus brigantina]
IPGQKTHFISQSNKIVPPAQSSQSHLSPAGSKQSSVFSFSLLIHSHNPAFHCKID